MNLELEITAPPGMRIEASFRTALTEILTRAEVGFEIDELTNGRHVVRLLDVENAESRYVLRILQRSGYDVTLPPG